MIGEINWVCITKNLKLLASNWVLGTLLLPVQRPAPIKSACFSVGLPTPQHHNVVQLRIYAIVVGDRHTDTRHPMLLKLKHLILFWLRKSPLYRLLRSREASITSVVIGCGTKVRAFTKLRESTTTRLRNLHKSRRHNPLFISFWLITHEAIALMPS